MQHTTSQSIHQRASKVMPLGVSSNFRYWGEGKTLIVKRGEGAYLWDADDNHYVDYRLGFGPLILGHAHPEVNQNVVDALQAGTVYAMTTEREIRVAEKIVEMCPTVDMVRFANSGTEATMHAIRLARAYTGRDKILKFEGHFHGMHDHVLWSTAGASLEALGERHAPTLAPSSTGIPAAVRDLVVPVPYNDRDALQQTLEKHRGEIAAVIAEAILGNMASIEPHEDFLQFVREVCDANGIVFILDEVKTGFRVAPGGAQEIYNVRADVTTFAKALGNGYPVAAIGGNAEIMGIIGDGVAQGGTYTANTVGIAAVEKVLEIISTTDALQRVSDRGRQLQNGLSTILEAQNIPHRFSGHPSMLGVHFTDTEIRDSRAWHASNYPLYHRALGILIENGHMPEPDSREPWFLSAAHSEDDINDTLNALKMPSNRRWKHNHARLSIVD